ncbi:hypothetical protein [Actinoplanes subtropicus]|uniref:hypothetical protein n=1 Tax=Actinoplanes subtropicus TaxID=543632 RepID=UPI0004C3992B|nr:hypothetical protein [Actinoplanes subtropicus]
MEPRHAEIARVALQAAGVYGFALAGGYAVSAHGIRRITDADFDLYDRSLADLAAMRGRFDDRRKQLAVE